MIPAVVRFVAAPASPRPLALLRVGIAATLLLQAALLWADLPSFFGSSAVVSRALREAIADRPLPALELDASLDWLARHGVEQALALRALFVVYAASLVGLLLGWRTRVMAIVAWWLQQSLLVWGQLAVHGGSAFAHIALFYCLLLPVAGAWSLDRRAGRTTGAPTALVRLGLRAIQIHLCVVYFEAGAAKLLGEQYLSGEAAWYALFHADWITGDLTWLARMPWLVAVATWLTLIVELGYPFMIWPRRTRRGWALLTIVMHAGFAVGMGLWVFSLVMSTFTAAVFLLSAAPQDSA